MLSELAVEKLLASSEELVGLVLELGEEDELLVPLLEELVPPPPSPPPPPTPPPPLELDKGELAALLAERVTSK